MSSQENYSFLLGTLHFERVPLYDEREYQQNKTLKLNFLKLTVATIYHLIPEIIIF